MADRLGKDINATRRASGIGAWAALVVVLAAGLIGLMPTFETLGPKWLDTHGYSHGPLVAAICLGLIWMTRHTIGATETHRSVLAFVLLAGGLFLWMLSWAANVGIGVEALFPATLWLAAAALIGPAGAWALAFPIGFLYFAISMWDAINGTLQAWTTIMVSLMLPALGVPVYIQGNHVQIPAGWFEIAGGCSGLHFFVVGLALAALYGYLYYGGWVPRLKLLAVAAVGTLVLNWVRVTTIIVAGHLTDMQSYLVQVDHYTFGWVLFGVALLPFYMYAGRLERGDPGPRRATVAPAATSRVPVTRLNLVTAFLLAPAVLWLRPVPGSADVELALPPVNGWQGPLAPETGWRPRFAQADVVIRGGYVRHEGTVDVYLNWYAAQGPGREVIGHGNRIEGDHEIVSRRVHKLELDRSDGISLNEMILADSSGRRRVVWYWYQIGHRTEVSPIRAKIIGGWQVMTGEHGAGIVGASAACESDCEAARKRVAEWLRDARAPLTAAMTSTSESAPGRSPGD